MTERRPKGQRVLPLLHEVEPDDVEEARKILAKRGRALILASSPYDACALYARWRAYGITRHAMLCSDAGLAARGQTVQMGIPSEAPTLAEFVGDSHAKQIIEAFKPVEPVKYAAVRSTDISIAKDEEHAQLAQHYCGPYIDPSFADVAHHRLWRPRAPMSAIRSQEESRRLHQFSRGVSQTIGRELALTNAKISTGYSGRGNVFFLDAATAIHGGSQKSRGFEYISWNQYIITYHAVILVKPPVQSSIGGTPNNTWSRPHNTRDWICRFEDGWGVCAVNGRCLSPDTVFNGVAAERVLRERNAELRSAYLQLVDFKDLLTQVHHKCLDSSEWGTLYNLELPANSELQHQNLCVVHVVNHTPEPDGTYRDFFLFVPHRMHTAKQAVAWTFGVEPEQLDRLQAAS